MTVDFLLKAGFELRKCHDGMFWVIEKRPGADADDFAQLCGASISDYTGDGIVDDVVILQCDENFKNPVFYLDCNVWDLSIEEFGRLVAVLNRQ